MLGVELKGVEKDYGKGSIFNAVTVSFPKGSRTAICGTNGSGKSSLLKIISGYSTPSKGYVSFSSGGKALSTDKVALETSYASPALELPGELTIAECISLHASLRQEKSSGMMLNLVTQSGLEKALNARLHQLSSGMLQRLKLILAIGSRAGLLLLDEPVSNLDLNGVNFYKEILRQYCSSQTVIIASNNNPDELFFCTGEVEILPAKST
jgi:ABC-type multidrug transport system ATPase subunit